jgi:L-lactate dehydrogenase complex protein LldG
VARNVLAYLKYDAPAHVTLPHNLITGASGPADVEGSYVRGTHGPRHLHIVLVER